jgi:hypothetical protein
LAKAANKTKGAEKKPFYDDAQELMFMGKLHEGDWATGYPDEDTLPEIKGRITKFDRHKIQVTIRAPDTKLHYFKPSMVEQ